MTISRLLHQVWLGPKRCPIEAIQTWIDHNPRCQHLLWTEKEVDALGGKFKNRDLYDAFDGVYHAQADILRYELLCIYGGITLDADSICLRELDSRFFDVPEQAWACSENNSGLLACGFLGAAVAHPLFEAVREELGQLDREAIQNETREELHGAAWVLTGPCCLSEVVKASKIPVKVFPGHWFFPTHHDGSTYQGSDPPFSYHWWGTTHRSYENPDVISAVDKLISQTKHGKSSK